jgi:hypothetical protein
MHYTCFDALRAKRFKNSSSSAYLKVSKASLSRAQMVHRPYRPFSDPKGAPESVTKLHCMSWYGASISMSIEVVYACIEALVKDQHKVTKFQGSDCSLHDLLGCYNITSTLAQPRAAYDYE